MGSESVEIRERIENDADYVYLRRFEFSLVKLLQRYPEGVPDHLIAQGLLRTEEEIGELYEATVAKLRKFMGVHPL